jgi:hypothetical protein
MTDYYLYYGSSRKPVAKIVPDKRYGYGSGRTGMWRIELPDGSLSDMVNITRAKDAAAAIAERGPPARDRQRLHWRNEPIEQPLGSPTTALKERRVA